MHRRNDWPAHVSIAGSKPSAIHTVAITIAVASGAPFSVFLLELYAPVAFVHEQCIAAAAAAEHGRSGVEIAKWIEQEGLNQSPAATPVPMLAIAGPSLTALGLPGLPARMGWELDIMAGCMLTEVCRSIGSRSIWAVYRNLRFPASGAVSGS